MFKTIGVWEIVLILVIIFIFFGVGKLPQVGNAMGKAIRAFKRGQTGEDDENTGKDDGTKTLPDKEAGNKEK